MDDPGAAVSAAKRGTVLGVGGEARAKLERAGAGVAVKPGDAYALSRAIAGLAADSGRRARMAIAGGRFVTREFSRRVWAAQYVDVLVGITKRVPSAEPVTIPTGE
jgi:glycosyltransferase involved in cell wall biosynthesis